MNRKVVLITGASSGIGSASAKMLAENGHKVYAAARSADKMESLKKYGVIPIKMDITKHEEVKAAINFVMEEESRIDVLFNNAGFGLYGPLEKVPLEDARYQFDVNLFGLADVTKLVLPIMREQKCGLIINTSSVGGKIYTPGGAWYHATKHALEGWSDVLRMETKRFGIDVVILEPGLINTGFLDVLSQRGTKYLDDDNYSEMMDKVNESSKKLYGQNGSHPDVIAKVVLKAVNSKRPKTRYAAGAFAKPFLFMRKILSDRVFDRLIWSQMS